MSSWVLDATAVLALVHREPGAAEVAAVLADGATIGAVNLSEVVGKLSLEGVDVHEALDLLRLEVIAFDADLAYQAGLLRPRTTRAGLSLGDRACLVLAKRLGLPVVTADRVWQGVDIGVEIRLIR